MITTRVPTVKFAHIHDVYGSRTIGFKINDATGTVDYAIAQCNAKDTFNKKLGRAIVTGRLEKGGIHQNGSPRSYTVPLDKIGSTRYRDIVEFIETHY